MSETITLRRTLSAILLIGGLLLSLGLSACVYHHQHHAPAKVERQAAVAPGPPPWAPAHGYRHKHHGRELVYDAGLGVYVVLGDVDVYFSHNRYYRYRDGHWQLSVRLDGSWGRIEIGDLPRGLKVHRTKAKKRHRKDHAPPAKHR